MAAIEREFNCTFEQLNGRIFLLLDKDKYVKVDGIESHIEGYKGNKTRSYPRSYLLKLLKLNDNKWGIYWGADLAIFGGLLLTPKSDKRTHLSIEGAIPKGAIDGLIDKLEKMEADALGRAGGNHKWTEEDKNEAREKYNEVNQLIEEKDLSIPIACNRAGLPKSTYYRYKKIFD